jgi:hypothetical protein
MPITDAKDIPWFTFSCKDCPENSVMSQFACCSKVEGHLLIMFSITGAIILIATIVIQWIVNNRRLNDFTIEESKKSSSQGVSGSDRLTQGKQFILQSSTSFSLKEIILKSRKCKKK